MFMNFKNFMDFKIIHENYSCKFKIKTKKHEKHKRKKNKSMKIRRIQRKPGKS